MIYTTLNRIREHEPCADGWRKLLKHLGKIEADDEPLAYSTILDAVGLDDALWCLRAEPQHESIWRMFAVRRVRSKQHLMTDGRSLQALDVAERHARGLATDAELAAVWTAAGDAVWAAAGAAARAAARAAAEAAAGVAWAAAGAAAWIARPRLPGRNQGGVQVHGGGIQAVRAGTADAAGLRANGLRPAGAGGFLRRRSVEGEQQ